MKRGWISLWILLLAFGARAEAISVATLNCYWFFNGKAGVKDADTPRDKLEYTIKGGHLIGLLPPDGPLFVGFQEIGDSADIDALANSATARYRHKYESMFVQGKDSATGQDVGAILDTSRGWGVYGRASRVSDLERELSKHLVVRLTNAVTVMDVCVVHLRRPMGTSGVEKHRAQCQALLRWAMRHLAQNPKANLVILGDFNVGEAPGAPDSPLTVLSQARPPLFDALTTLSGKVRTHADGKAYDRIIVSDAILRSAGGLTLEKVLVQEHRHGKGEERRAYTDHFPVLAVFTK